MVLSQSQSCAAAVELTNSLGEVSLLGVSERILHACSFSDDVTDTSSATLLKLLAGIGNNTRINV
jgi:hypothetical protein